MWGGGHPSWLSRLSQAFKESAFRVETNKWKKGDELVDGTERRTFTFLAESKDEKELWLYQIRLGRCFAGSLLPTSGYLQK